MAPAGGDLELRYASMLASLERRLLELSPDRFVPRTSSAQDFRDTTPFGQGLDGFSHAIGHYGAVGIDAGRISRPLLGGWVRTVAGVLCLLWLPLCVPNMVRSVRTRWRRMRSGPNACYVCGYDCSATPPGAPCPECGDAPLVLD